jgi:hypothetical protein
MIKMLVIVPSRGRPDNVVRLEAMRSATSVVKDNVDFLYVVDDDDPAVMRYVGLDLPQLAVIHRQRLGPTLNMMAALNAGQYDALGFMGDDHLPRTIGWDASVLGILDSAHPRVVYGNDLLQGANLPTAVFMQSKIVQALGYMVPPGMVHLYLDNFWKELGERLDGLVYLDHIVIEHIHPANGKAEMDQTYREANATEVDTADRSFWLNYRQAEKDGLADAIRRVNEGYAR